MAMSDLQVFQEYAYTERREQLDYNINLFNEATRGGLILRGGNHQGDYSEESFWANLSGIIRRRSPYSDGALTELNLSMLLQTSVKVGTGTTPIRLDPAWLRWIAKSPSEAGVQFGKNLAEQTLLDMVNTAVTALIAALKNDGTMVYDGSAGTMAWNALTSGMQKYGDQQSNLACWVMHSTPWFELLNANLTNNEKLFTFGDVVVMSDPMGRPFIMSDLPALIQPPVSGVAGKFRTLGLTPGAVLIEENPDFDQNTSTTNGNENLKRTYQSEWSYNVGMKGFTWDIANGGKAPSNAALATGTNWDKVAQYQKSLPAVVVETKGAAALP